LKRLTARRCTKGQIDDPSRGFFKTGDSLSQTKKPGSDKPGFFAFYFYFSELAEIVGQIFQISEWPRVKKQPTSVQACFLESLPG